MMAKKQIRTIIKEEFEKAIKEEPQEPESEA